MKPKKVGILTAGGLAPCLSSAIGGLIERYTEIDPSIEIICYLGGYKGLLLGQSIKVDDKMRAQAHILHRYGGSPIGNSRVKLTNVKDCVKRGLVKEGEDPQKVAADQLVKDKVDILHTIGGDDTNTAAADLAKFLKENNYELTVIGLPKTIDNDVYPIRQSLGAWTAAEEGAKFFRNVVSENGANPRMLIVHEVMGRNCGWLTAATAAEYRKLLAQGEFADGLGLTKMRRDVHAVYIPEMELDIAKEAARLKKIMDENDCVNIFISEGAGVKTIVAEMEAKGEEVPRDAFGHVKLDAVNPGKWFGKHKVAPLVSPNKTVEGCVTGAVSSLFVGLIVYFIFKDQHTLSVWLCMGTAFLASTMGQIGDLAESLLKRMIGVKDFSNLIPGHGGMFDRADSLLFSIPTAYLCLFLANI